MKVLRPFFRRYGSKWLLSRKLDPPKHDVIVEPFAGSASYSCRYGADQHVILIDKDPIVAAIWAWLLAATPEDVLALPVDIGRTDIRKLGLSTAPMRLIQAWLKPNASPYTWRFAKSTLVHAVRQPGSYWSERTRLRIATQLQYLKHWSISVDAYSSAPDIKATWLIDPPYQHQSQHNTQYGARVTDFEALGAWCRSRTGQVFVHEQHGADWLDFHSLDTASCTSFTYEGKRKRAHEVLWTNTP